MNHYNPADHSPLPQIKEACNAWKDELYRYGSEVEVVIAKMDTAISKYESALDKSRMAATFGSKVGFDMNDMLDDIKHDVTVNGTIGPKARGRMKQMEGTVDTLLVEVSDCEVKFLEADEEFKAVHEYIDAQLSQMQKRFFKKSKKVSFWRTIASVAAATALIATAGAALLPILVASPPLGVIIAAPVIAAVGSLFALIAEWRGEHNLKEKQKLTQDGDKLSEIKHCVNIALEDMQKVSKYWSDIQTVVSKLPRQPHEFANYRVSDIEALQEEWQKIQNGLGHQAQKLGKKHPIRSSQVTMSNRKA